jgi:hypothetical protein
MDMIIKFLLIFLLELSCLLVSHGNGTRGIL